MRSAMNKSDYLSAMNVPQWQLRVSTSVCSDEPSNLEPEKPTWQALQEQVINCKACRLCDTRTQTVFGTGDCHADILIVGEAPGANEDRQGEPFVGRAGQLLNQMLKSIGFARESVYIANILKCRPPQNRDPKTDEIEQCTPYLDQQIELLKPKKILALGRFAAQYLSGSNASMGKLRQSVHSYQGIPLYASYHPAYLLRSPKEKRKAWQDLCRLNR